jgi:predicted transcriptional regulator
MPPRRSKLEIMLTVLSAVRNGEGKPTKIMYATNLSWVPTQKMLSDMVEQGLLIKREYPKRKRSKTRYEISEKGIRILDYFEKAEDVIGMDLISP